MQNIVFSIQHMYNCTELQLCTLMGKIQDAWPNAWLFENSIYSHTSPIISICSKLRMITFTNAVKDKAFVGLAIVW